MDGGQIFVAGPPTAVLEIQVQICRIQRILDDFVKFDVAVVATIVYQRTLTL